MKAFPIAYLKSILVGGLICLSSSIAIAQEFEIWGESDLVCGEVYHYYLFIGPNHVTNIEWEIFPDEGYFHQNGDVSVEIGFYQPGNYYIVATGMTWDSMLISDTLLVNVFQFIDAL